MHLHANLLGDDVLNLLFLYPSYRMASLYDTSISVDDTDEYTTRQGMWMCVLYPSCVFLMRIT